MNKECQSTINFIKKLATKANTSTVATKQIRLMSLSIFTHKHQKVNNIDSKKTKKYFCR